MIKKKLFIRGDKLRAQERPELFGKEVYFI